MPRPWNPRRATWQGRGGHGRVPGTHLAGLASSHRLVTDGTVVLDRGNAPGSAVDPGLDAAASALRAEPAAPGGLLHARHRLYLSTSAASITRSEEHTSELQSRP